MGYHSTRGGERLVSSGAHTRMGTTYSMTKPSIWAASLVVMCFVLLLFSGQCYYRSVVNLARGSSYSDSNTYYWSAATPTSAHRTDKLLGLKTEGLQVHQQQQGSSATPLTLTKDAVAKQEHPQQQQQLSSHPEASEAMFTNQDTVNHTQHPMHSGAVRAGKLASSNGHKTIPFIIHQNYMSGIVELKASAMRQQTHFRKEWWLSCKTHHPGWLYMFWDATACESLLAERYPWFLDTYKALPSIVIKSDAMRPFILHAYGGVYLDVDTECFGNMEAWITGPQVVLTAEEPFRLNNAQMAGTAGHFIWEKYQRIIHSNLKQGNVNPILATGPSAITGVVKGELERAGVGASLQGHHKLPDGTSLVVYGKGQWFSPCSWDGQDCMVTLSHDKLLLRAKAAKAAVAAEAARRASNLSKPVDSGVPVMIDVQAVVGVHQFSGSWTSWKESSLDKSFQLIVKGGLAGVLDYMSDGTKFVEQDCPDLKIFGNTIPACWSVLGKQVEADTCVVYSVHTLPEGWDQQRPENQSVFEAGSADGAAGVVQHNTPTTRFAAEYELARAGCTVHLITNKATQIDETFLAQQPSAAPAESDDKLQRSHHIKSHLFQIGPVPDPFADPPVASLDQLMELLHHDRITLMHLSFKDTQPGAPTLLDVLNTMYLSSATVLDRVHSLSLHIPQPNPAELRKLYSAFQHILQEQGLRGVYHRRLGTATHHVYQLGLMRP